MNTQKLYLKPDSDLKKSIEDFSKKKNYAGFVVSIVGDLSSAVVKCPNQETASVVSGTLEIITLNGTIDNGNVHLHMSFSDENCSVFGGHLEYGSTVLKGADVLLAINTSSKNSDYLHSSSVTNDSLPKLEVATLNNCPWSTRIKRILSTSSIPYHINEVVNDDSFSIVKARSGTSTFPQVFYNGEYIGGYDEFIELYEKLNLNLNS